MPSYATKEIIFSWSSLEANLTETSFITNKSIQKIIMFSFHTHEVLSSIHKVESDFWEEMLDKLYSKVVQKHKSCLGLISNTIKTKPNDKVGEFSENTQFLFKSKIDPEKHDLLLLIDKDKFNAIFQEYLAFEEDDRSDFYHLKEKYEIGFEMLVYPLYTQLEKKAFLMLEYPTEKIILDRICSEINRILSEK